MGLLNAKTKAAIPSHLQIGPKKLPFGIPLPLATKEKK